MAHPLALSSFTLAPVLAADFLAVGHEADRRYLEARWKRPVSGTEFRQGMEAVTQSVLVHRAELLLMDMRRTGTPSVSDQSWLVRHLVSANGTTTLRRSARLFSEDLFQRIVSELMDEKVGFPYQVRAFGSEARAWQWLFQGSGTRSDHTGLP
jgi:hypothetical protein